MLIEVNIEDIGTGFKRGDRIIVEYNPWREQFSELRFCNFDFEEIKTNKLFVEQSSKALRVEDITHIYKQVEG